MCMQGKPSREQHLNVQQSTRTSFKPAVGIKIGLLVREHISSLHYGVSVGLWDCTGGEIDLNRDVKLKQSKFTVTRAGLYSSAEIARAFRNSMYIYRALPTGKGVTYWRRSQRRAADCKPDRDVPILSTRKNPVYLDHRSGKRRDRTQKADQIRTSI